MAGGSGYCCGACCILRVRCTARPRGVKRGHSGRICEGSRYTDEPFNKTKKQPPNIPSESSSWHELPTVGWVGQACGTPEEGTGPRKKQMQRGWPVLEGWERGNSAVVMYCKPAGKQAFTAMMMLPSLVTHSATNLPEASRIIPPTKLVRVGTVRSYRALLSCTLRLSVISRFLQPPCFRMFLVRFPSSRGLRAGKAQQSGLSWFRRRKVEKRRMSYLRSLRVGKSETSMAYGPLCKLQQSSRRNVPMYQHISLPLPKHYVAGHNFRNGSARSQHHLQPRPPPHQLPWLVADSTELLCILLAFALALCPKCSGSEVNGGLG